MHHIPDVGTTSDNLLDGVQNNIPEIWSELVHQYTPLVYGWCRRSGFSPEDSADISQNVFSSVHQSINNFKKSNTSHSFRSWLWTITRNRIYDYVQTLSKMPPAPGGSGMHQFLKQQAAPHIDSDSTNEDTMINLLYIAMANVSTKVNERTWQAFEMLSFDFMSYREVAEKLGITETTVRGIKSRILNHLKQEIEKLKNPE